MKTCKLLCFLLPIFGALISNQAFCQTGWKQDASAYGCGMSEGLAYQDAESSVNQNLAGYAARCAAEGGTFSSSISRGQCKPFNPNDLSCPAECLAWGTAFCQPYHNYVVDDITVREASGGSNSDGSFDPGETILIEIKFRNLGSKPIANVKASVKFDGPSGILNIEHGDATIASVNPGEVKTFSLLAKITSTVACGSKGWLRFVLENPDFRRSYMNVPFKVGKLAAEPIVIEKNNFGMQLTPQGLTLELQDIAADVDLDVFQVHLDYVASVKFPSKYRMWLTAQSRENTTWAYRVNEKQPEVHFSEDLSSQLPKAKVKGKWFISGDLPDPSNSVLVNYVKLKIVPDKFTCNW